MKTQPVWVQVAGGLVCAGLVIAVISQCDGGGDEVAPPDAAVARPDAAIVELEGEPVSVRDLEVDKTYRASGKVPLMPALNPKDPVAATAAGTLPAGVPFKVIAVGQRNGTPWYRVTSPEGGGWINSVALGGEKVVEAN